MYAGFAYIYDHLMRDAPYSEWVSFIRQIIAREGISPQQVLELGCGTGNITVPMAEQGYQVTAVDLSPDMLAVADAKARDRGLKINFINQDMRGLEINQTYQLVLAMCDSLNYILEDADLKAIFSKVYGLLDKEGMFIFDLNSSYKISTVFGQETYTYLDEEVCYIWDNSFDPATKICTMEMNFFVRENNGHYRRFEEVHSEKAYETEEIISWLKESSFREVKVFAELGFTSPEPTSERIYFVAKP